MLANYLLPLGVHRYDYASTQKKTTNPIAAPPKYFKDDQQLEPYIVSIIANVSSGIVGAIFGALVVWFVSYRERLHAARSRLTHLLLKNGHTIWYGQGDSQAWQVIDSNYAEIQAEYLALRRLIFFTKRLNLENAWINYTGVGHYRDIPDDEPAKIFAKSAVSRDQAIQRIISFLKAIG